MKKTFSFLFALISFLTVQAQNDSAEQAKGLRADGKIYVVIAVVVTILLGLIIYLVRLDRKISKLERKS